MLLQKIVFISILLAMFTCFATAQASKIVHQTFTLDKAEKVNINVVAKKINIKETRGSRILVETKVTISVSNPRLLDFICNSGRYELIKKVDNSLRELSLGTKKTNDVIIIKGKECYEELELTVYIPKSVQVINNSTLVDGNEE